MDAAAPCTEETREPRTPPNCTLPLKSTRSKAWGPHPQHAPHPALGDLVTSPFKPLVPQPQGCVNSQHKLFRPNSQLTQFLGCIMRVALLLVLALVASSVHAQPPPGSQRPVVRPPGQVPTLPPGVSRTTVLPIQVEG